MQQKADKFSVWDITINSLIMQQRPCKVVVLEYLQINRLMTQQKAYQFSVLEYIHENSLR